ncbi:MAG: protein jag [Anaerolineae bacterium]|nr:MAG: protein jag [Anaerolineae bacterium]
MNDHRPTLEVIAPTVEEAIEKGLAELGLERDQVDVEVLDEGSGGFLGIGARQARVMLIVRAPQEQEQPSTSPSSKSEAVAPATGGEDELVLDTVRSLLADLLELMHFRNLEIDVYMGEPYGPYNRQPIHADIRGNDLSTLIGPGGETLEALQTIARLMLGKELRRTVPLVIDVQGYRQRRTQQIENLARRIANQVAETGRSQALEPMPANERRIVHLALRDDPRVYTESTGEGTKRKVVIYPQE